MSFYNHRAWQKRALASGTMFWILPCDDSIALTLIYAAVGLHDTHCFTVIANISENS